MATPRVWITRLLAAAGLLPGEVSGDAEDYHRLLGATFASLALLVFVVGRFLITSTWDSTLAPIVNRDLPGDYTHVTVTKVLKPRIWSAPGYPYGYWASDNHKYADAVNYHAYVGERLTNYWDHGGALVWTRIGKRVVYTAPPPVPLVLVGGIVLLGASWVLWILLALLCFRAARRIHFDREAAPEVRRVRIDGLWQPWTESYLEHLRVPLAVPVFVTDQENGRGGVVMVPAARHREIPARGETVEIKLHPHTGALLHVEGRPVSAPPWRPEHHLRQVMFTLHRLTAGLNTGVAIFLFGVAWLSIPFLEPLWLPIHATAATVTRVYQPYTLEPSRYPWEVRISRYPWNIWFSHDPKLRLGDRVTIRSDWAGSFVGIDHGGKTDRSAIQSHPWAFVLLLLSSLYTLWRARRRSPDPGGISTDRLVTELTRIVHVMPPNTPVSLISLTGYSMTLRRVSDGSVLYVRVPARSVRAVLSFLQSVEWQARELEVTYDPASRILVKLEAPSLRHLWLVELQPSTASM